MHKCYFFKILISLNFPDEQLVFLPLVSKVHVKVCTSSLIPDLDRETVLNFTVFSDYNYFFRNLYIFVLVLSMSASMRETLLEAATD